MKSNDLQSKILTAIPSSNVNAIKLLFEYIDLKFDELQKQLKKENIKNNK